MAARGTPSKRPTERTCKEITALILDYLGDELSASIKQDFERHLSVCPDCVRFLSTYKKTVSLSRSLNYENIPARLRSNVRGFLKRKTGSDKSKGR